MAKLSRLDRTGVPTRRKRFKREPTWREIAQRQLNAYEAHEAWRRIPEKYRVFVLDALRAAKPHGSPTAKRIRALAAAVALLKAER
jgi:hypothetical protein